MEIRLQEWTIRFSSQGCEIATFKKVRSGYRLIYWLRTPKDVILVTIYSKLDQGDISAKEIRRIIKQFQEL